MSSFSLRFEFQVLQCAENNKCRQIEKNHVSKTFHVSTSPHLVQVTQMAAIPEKSTPDYFHVLRPPFKDNVYEPEADTFLFLDAVDIVVGEMLECHPRFRCIEIGCGSGTVITHLASLLLKRGDDELDRRDESKLQADISTSCKVFDFHAVDVNPLAIEATKITWAKTIGELCGLKTHCGNLFSPFETTDCAGAGFDIVLFNPPYVPTTDEELNEAVVGDPIKRAWCGGPRGRSIVDRFLLELPRWLSPGGRALVVAIKQNDVDDLIEFAECAFPTDSKPEIRVVTSRFTGEELCVLEILNRC